METWRRDYNAASASRWALGETAPRDVRARNRGYPRRLRLPTAENSPGWCIIRWALCDVNSLTRRGTKTRAGHTRLAKARFFPRFRAMKS